MLFPESIFRHGLLESVSQNLQKVLESYGWFDWFFHWKQLDIHGFTLVFISDFKKYFFESLLKVSYYSSNKKK